MSLGQLLSTGTFLGLAAAARQEIRPALKMIIEAGPTWTRRLRTLWEDYSIRNGGDYRIPDGEASERAIRHGSPVPKE